MANTYTQIHIHAVFAVQNRLSLIQKQWQILNFFIKRDTNALAESFNATIKTFRATLRGVQDMKFFLFRVAKIFA